MFYNINEIIFFDIETVPCAETLDNADENIQISFTEYCKKRFLKDNPDISVESLFLEKAALIPEFAKIACISIGRIDDSDKYKITSLYNDNGENDYTILNKFSNFLIINSDCWLCGYNILQFDIPFITKHMIKYNVKIPNILKLYFSKPWERQIFDIFDFWRGQRYEYLPSLQMVSSFLNCGNPKENLDGSKVKDYYWNNSIESSNIIKKYCENDVMTIMCILNKLVESGCI